MIRLPPISSLFPYTTLFRSQSFVVNKKFYNSQLLVFGFNTGVRSQTTVRVQVQHTMKWEARFLHRDRKSTRLNSSHSQISYAVFCLKKKIQKNEDKSYSINY